MADILQWLTMQGLEKLAPIFVEHEIDFDTLPLLTEADVRELGLPLGPRRKLLAALGVLRGGEMSPPRDEAERRQLTVMFVDLADSTALAARLDPEAMRDVLRSYQNAVAGEITRVGGHVAKLMGDGVLAYFGWPRAHEDDAERAVRAGLAAAAAVGRMTDPAGEALAARVGIATGLVVVGDLIGEGAAQEHAVVGTTPNLAARLQAEAGAGQVVIAAGTRRLLDTRFVVDAMGERLLKGHDTPLPLFRVLHEETRQSRFASSSGGTMVGRAAELAAMLAAWQQAKDRGGQAVLLTGEAGIGKSRLLRSLVEAIAGDSPAQEFFQCSTMHSESPFWPIAQRLALNADIVADDDTPTREAKLSRMLRQRTAEPDGAAMILRPLLGLPDKFDKADNRAQTHRRRDTIDILIRQVLAAARTKPALLIFEDLQWADRGTLDVLRNLVGAIGNAPILLVATTRDDRTLRLGDASNLLRIPLGRLDPATAAALIAETAGKRRLAPRTVETILGRSDGIPLFVEEITKAVVEAAPGTESTVPSTLRDSLIARLDVLPAMKAVAQIAACIGREFEESVLRQSADLAAATIGEGLERLTSAGLFVAESGGRYLFRHAMLCDIAYETLLTPRRQSLHERIAKTLEAMPDGRALSEPEVLARHWFGAGQHDRAEVYWLQARHRAAHWQDQFDALADFLDADATGTRPMGGSGAPKTLH